MANMPKRGLDYFATSVNQLRDRKIALLIKNHGPQAFVAYECLIENIFFSGSYLKFDSKDELLWTIELSCYISNEEANKILDVLITSNFFDLRAYREGFLTSKEIQKQYYFATKERKSRITKECWLLSEDEMNEIDAGIKYKKIMGGENKIIPTDNKNNPDDNSQSNSNSQRESKSKNQSNINNDNYDKKDNELQEKINKIDSMKFPFEPTYYFKYFIVKGVITGYEDYAYWFNSYIKSLYDEYDNKIVNEALVKVANRFTFYGKNDQDGNPIVDMKNYLKSSIENQIHKERCYESGLSPFDENYGVF